MKGLASTSPALAKVGIRARSARKHYGLCVARTYIEGQHDKSLRSVIAHMHETLDDFLFYHSLTRQILGFL